MEDRFPDITAKAAELASMIQSAPCTRRYANALDSMKEDTRAQEVYARLVKLGKEITDIKDKDKELSDEFISENARLRDEIVQFPVVTEFIESQKDYFELMKKVQDTLKILA